MWYLVTTASERAERDAILDKVVYHGVGRDWAVAVLDQAEQNKLFSM